MKINKSIFLVFIFLSLCSFPFAVEAQYVLKNSVFSNGGVVSTDTVNNNLYSSIGQNIIGKSENSSYSTLSGFWYQSSGFITSIREFSDLVPKKFDLYQNYPNPFNPATHIKFALPKQTKVKIDVFNVLGQHIVTILNANKPAGYHIINLNAYKFASGLYFYTMQTDNFSKVKKMLLVR